MPDQKQRGRRASFDPASGAVHGAGSGAGGGGNPNEDYDSDSMGGGGEPGGSGHPLPESDEARHDLIPESAERAKGVGDDGGTATHPGKPAVNPDGKSYEESAAAEPE